MPLEHFRNGLAYIGPVFHALVCSVHNYSGILAEINAHV